MDDNKRRQIKSCFRQSMNADLSNSMRSHGLSYKINFGVPAPRIRLIAEQFEPNAADATELWQEHVRESKMLATYLFPPSEMTLELAQEWAHQIPYTEIADQACMNLFCRLPFALDLSFQWMQQQDAMLQYTGLRLMSRLFMMGVKLNAAQLQQLSTTLRLLLLSQTAYVQTAALHLAEKQIDGGQEQARFLQQTLQDWAQSEELLQKQLFVFLFGE